MLLGSLVHVATVKPALELADVLAAHFADYLKVAHCTAAQFTAVNAILKCRTAALGGHLRVCDVCGRVQLVFNSCGNRNCPKCGAFERAQWLAQQGARLLPAPHFHAVFTLDHRVNALAEVNPKAIYDLLFATANQPLKAFARQYLGGEIGVTAVLHTWGQTLQHHIHLHCMVTAGALVPTQRGYRFRKCAKGFLFPVVALSQQFRDAFCAGLRRLGQRGELRLVGACADLVGMAGHRGAFSCGGRSNGGRSRFAGALRVERRRGRVPSATPGERGEPLSGTRCATFLGTGRCQTMNTMTYRGYAARIEYSDEDQCLVGYIAGINDVVGFHGDKVTELRAAFEEAVEDYLETCEKLGRAPQKPYSGKPMLRVPPEVHAAVAVAAQVSGKSINQWAVEVFTRAVHA